MFVVDSSVALAWCFDDETSPESERLLGLAYAEGITVPSIWHDEMANIFLVSERRGRSTPAKTATFITLIRSLPLSTDVAERLDITLQVLELGREHQLTAYDSAYLELAMRLGLPLATLDRRLQAAAQASAVQLIQ